MGNAEFTIGEMFYLSRKRCGLRYEILCLSVLPSWKGVNSRDEGSIIPRWSRVRRVTICYTMILHGAIAALHACQLGPAPWHKGKKR